MIFATSDGWPIRCPPIVSQLRELAASPAPLPSTKSDASTISVTRYDGQATHSRKRTDARVTSSAATSDIAEPDDLRSPQARDDRWHVGLPRGIDHQDAEDREQERQGDEREVRNDFALHQPSVAGRLAGATLR